MCLGSGPKPVLLFLWQVSFVFPKQGRFSLLFSILLESLPSSLSSTHHKPWALRPFLLPLGFWRDFSCKIKLTHLLFHKHASTLCLGVWVSAKLCIFEIFGNHLPHFSGNKMLHGAMILGWATCTLLLAFFHCCLLLRAQPRHRSSFLFVLSQVYFMKYHGF